MGKNSLHNSHETWNSKMRGLGHDPCHGVTSPMSKDTKTMKCFNTYLVLLLAIMLLACKESAVPSETPSCEKAALELYYQYADNPNLTVAYLSDLEVNGKGVNALMLQANNEADWEALKREFGIMTIDSTVLDCPSDDNPVLVGVAIEADFLDEAVLDTLTNINQISEEDIEKYSLIVADKIREIMMGFQAQDSLSNTNAVIVGQDEVMPGATDITYDDYIMTVSRAIVVGMIEERIHSPKNSKDDTSEIIKQNNRIMDDAQTHGHIGYVTAADNDHLALWLFFYDNQEECNTIIAHIREDIIVNE